MTFGRVITVSVSLLMGYAALSILGDLAKTRSR